VRSDQLTQFAAAGQEIDPARPGVQSVVQRHKPHPSIGAPAHPALNSSCRRTQAGTRHSGTAAVLASRLPMTQTQIDGDAGVAGLRQALEAADRLINRLQEIVADQLSRGEAIDEKEGFYEIVETLETAREVTRLRMALGDDPHRFGEPTPTAGGDHTG
jgi:hypothetical protein